ncbi:apolipophorins-like [Octopus vulgaris]|uniref:Apolipophorins-like n=1 Tax=Octopus vulgaris TaxID=6645 RepID=A0AA36BXY0_OCTVU|nr:apolipophorins-like [Octopus vulgaris]
MRMNYQSNRYAKQEYLMLAKVDRARREVKLRLEKPGLEVEYTGRLIAQENYIAVEVEKEGDGIREVILSATGKRDGNEMSMNIAYNTEDPSKKVGLDAKLEEKKFMLQIYRKKNYWNRGNDFSLTIEKRPMSVRFYSFLWNPSAITDIREYVISQMRTFGQKVQDRTERAVEKINQEFVKVMDVLSEDFEPVIEYLGKELIDIKSQADAYLRKITESKYYKVARTYARLAWDEFWDLYEIAVRELEKEMEYWQQVVSHWMVNLQVIVDSYIEEVEEIYSMFEQYLIDIGDSGFMYTSDWGFFDIYYDIKPSSDVNNWLPPFKAQASFFKDKYVTTFDGYHYDFQGSCGYTLAEAKKNFKVVAKFDEYQKKMTYITITDSRSNVYTIYSDGKVTANSSDVQLPFTKYYTHIYREGDTYILQNKRGYNIRFNPRIELVTLELNNVRVTNMDYAPEGQQFSDALMKQGLRFSFQDGKIEEVCPMSEEPTWVLNIKRGILSAFQNSMDDLDRDVNITETDVVGKCLTEYKVQDTYRRTKTIHKSKDLLSCSDREYYRIAMNSVKYNVHSKVRSMPLMKSYHNCVQTLDMHDNILTKSECTEENIFRPFSNGKSGAMTEQTQKLTFREKSSSNYRQTERFSHRSDLLFDHKETMYSDQLPTQEILSVFEELCDKMSEDIRPELPKMLNNLIDLMKSVDYATLRRIYSDISKEGFCRKNSDRTNIYVLSTVHISQPLLDNKKISHKVMLSISSMAASYCNKNPKCAEDFEIGALIQKYMSIVGDCDKDANPHVIQALRSLGNIGFSSKAERTLSKCVTTTNFPMEVRVSAIDAFRRIPCDARRSALMEVFVNTEEDSELRINAYLGLIKCPSRMLLRQIHEMLVIGNSNQVGSFIWSHLKNLRQTSDPHLQHIRSFLESEGVVKQFNLDKRKFSRNYGGSFFSKDMNAGAKLDSNVIFSPKSFIPRSANLNLTLDLFGHAINILEVGGRLEGFERDMENMWSSHRMTNAEPYRNGKSHMYLRFFGNEIFYGDTSRSLFFFRWSYFLTLFKTMQIVNSQVKYPTAIGFPLEMNVKATAAINNNDQTKWKQNGLDLAIKFSAVIEVSGDMTVDVHLTRMGLKMVSMAHTSTGVEFRADYKEITVKFPKNIIEYATIKTDFYTVAGENEIKLQLITDNVQKSKYPNHTVQFETQGSKSPRRLIVTGAKNRCTFYAETPWRNMKFRVNLRNDNKSIDATGMFKNGPGEYTLSLNISKEDINFQVNSKHSHTHTWPPKKIENKFMMQVSPRSVIKTEMYVSNIMTKGRRNSIAKLSYDYNGERMELNEELNQISGNAYKNKIDVQWATGRMVTLKTSLKNNPKVMFVENILGLPNQREAKLTTTVNKAHRDYGATIEFHADKEIIPTKEDIDWKAVSTIKYNIKRYEASMDTTLLLEWAPDKRIRATVSFDGADRGKSTAKISITTPFEVIQSYSESLEYEESNRKFTYSTDASWKLYNKENKWTEKLILNYDNNEYYYKYRHYYGNKITEVETSWNFKDYQKSMIFLLKYDNRPYIDMKVTHSKDRQQNEPR